MKKVNKLDCIKNIIETKTPHLYATERLSREKENMELAVLNTQTLLIRSEKSSDYYAYMAECWGNGESNEPLSLLIQRSYCAKLNDYAKHLKTYISFIENGSIFVFCKKENIIFFLSSGGDKETIVLTVHYNPSNVDLISYSISKQKFSQRIKDGQYEISKDFEFLKKQVR